MTETTKQRTDRLLGMSRGELVLHAQDLTYQRDELLAALKDAREDIEEWACYSSQYFREKHNLEACLTRYDALIARMEEGG